MSVLSTSLTPGRSTLVNGGIMYQSVVTDVTTLVLGLEDSESSFEVTG